MRRTRKKLDRTTATDDNLSSRRKVILHKAGSPGDPGGPQVTIRGGEYTVEFRKGVSAEEAKRLLLGLTQSEAVRYGELPPQNPRHALMRDGRKLTEEEYEALPRNYRVGESKNPSYTGGTMGDAAQDLNALAANLGLSFEEAATKLTAAARANSDPLSRARRVVRSFERQQHKNPDLPPSPDVVEARRFEVDPVCATAGAAS